MSWGEDDFRRDAETGILHEADCPRVSGGAGLSRGELLPLTRHTPDGSVIYVCRLCRMGVAYRGPDRVWAGRADTQAPTAIRTAIAADPAWMPEQPEAERAWWAQRIDATALVASRGRSDADEATDIDPTPPPIPARSRDRVALAAKAVEELRRRRQSVTVSAISHATGIDRETLRGYRAKGWIDF